MCFFSICPYLAVCQTWKWLHCSQQKESDWSEWIWMLWVITSSLSSTLLRCPSSVIAKHNNGAGKESETLIRWNLGYFITLTVKKQLKTLSESECARRKGFLWHMMCHRHWIVSLTMQPHLLFRTIKASSFSQINAAI